MCEHIHMIRVAATDGSGPSKPRDGALWYQCQDCHHSLWLRFVPPPPIKVTYPQNAAVKS